MSRSLRRLMAWAGLVAILASDPHAVAAIASLSAPPACSCSRAEGQAARSAEVPDCPEGSASCQCGHCAKCDARSEAGDQACTVDAGGPDDGQPGCPGRPSCPIPGGCALCCVSKVPCLAAHASEPAAALAVAPVLAEPAPLYASPSQGRLRRPPKA